MRAENSSRAPRIRGLTAYSQQLLLSRTLRDYKALLAGSDEAMPGGVCRLG
jgi:hypothetical protein